MYSRKRLDIGWSDLATGLLACATERDPAPWAARVEHWFDEGRGDALATLSVRSGLDLYLATLALPHGSEVLMSALTIQDMARVVEHHGLVAVPVDIDPATLAPRPEAWRAAAGPRTRLALVAHLFGTRVPLDPLVELRRERGILVLEDCAQSFTGADSKGDPDADVSMFSFGPIKTATALAGGVLCVRDARVLARMRATHATWPIAGQGAFARRILKYAGFKAISARLLYSAFVRLCEMRGTSADQVIQSSVRGFAGGEFFARIRHRPSAALLRLLARRLEAADGRRVAARTAWSRRLAASIGDVVDLPGARAREHSYWVFTLMCDHPAGLVASLRAQGFDATHKATLASLPAPASRPDADPREARALVGRLVYLPAYPEMGLDGSNRLAHAVRSAGRAEEPLVTAVGATHTA